MCQINTIVGDLHANVDRIIESLATATSGGADVAVFPELAITGYPPEDLLFRHRFVDANLDALQRVAAATTECVSIVGYVDRVNGRLFNAAAICHNGKVVGRFHKRQLPNYEVFDEQRYFAVGGPAEQLYEIAGVKVGVCICEDAWVVGGPCYEQSIGGAEIMLMPNASPFNLGKREARAKTLADRAAESSIPLVYVNQVGGQDELVFDGGSAVVSADGMIFAAATQFTDSLVLVDVPVEARGEATLPVLLLTNAPSSQRERMETTNVLPEPLTRNAEVYNALVLGTADYVRKNGFSDVVIGLSGGIDSSIVAMIAADALGAEHVHGVSMPSRYSSDGSRTDAKILADNLGIEMRTIPIEPAHQAMEASLEEVIGGSTIGLTDENLQSRLRGVTLMALSNQFGWLVLTTGNKSELAVGYSTLYGDTAGGFSVIKDVLKTEVYELCRWRNAQAENAIVSEAVLNKPPSAELRPDQTDDQSLPPYEVLDPILEAYVEHDHSPDEIVAQGFDPSLVKSIVRLVDLAEYKRRQSPLGVKVTRKAFGKDRRLPITNGFTHQ